MRQKIICILLFVFITSLISFAQEISQLKDYFSNSLYNINPAAAGYNGGFLSQASYSKYWTALPGSPECQVLSTSIRLGEEEFYDPKMFRTKPFVNLSNHVSLGITVFNETEGPLQHTGFMAAYAYHISINNMRLSFGLAGLITQYHLNTELFNPLVQDDPDLYTNTTAFVPDVNFGVMLYNRLLYLGISANGLANFDKILDHQQDQPDIVLFCGNKFITNNLFSFEPSMFVWRYGQGSLSTDFNLKIYYQEDNWLLIGHHGNNELLAGIGIGLIHGLQLGYVYSLLNNGLTNYLAGSQNITLVANIALLTRKHNYSW